MKHLDEYRDPAAVRRLTEALARVVTRPWVLMEVCGGQTHAILRFGLDELLPSGVTLIHGPGCPVCVTPVDMIDKALELAARPEVIFTSFGDMLRVPGTTTDLLRVKADGGDVRFVLSPLDALRIAQQNPQRQVVFFAVGFETTAPTTAMAVVQAKRAGLSNLSFLTAHVLVPPALEALLAAPANRVQGFLAAGHVCTVMGYDEYLPIVAKHRVPIVVTGFEPLDILQGVYRCVQHLEAGTADVVNEYARAVRREGNVHARAVIAEVFRVVDRPWRGLGVIPRSGLALVEAYADFDAEKRFGLSAARVELPTECIAGLVLQGQRKPHECPAFGTRCTPERPLGAPMVSSEGACAAYYRYRSGNCGSRIADCGLEATVHSLSSNPQSAIRNPQ